MTTDITELALRLKTAAEKAKHAGETPVMPFDARISALNEYQITACPDNILALVAALEKAQQMIDELEGRMALAAMDSSESVELPLDYLQGHKDGLEWAARLAEANHPETGDWLYDDPIELAKAIRKGPYMPPVQPVADSEPVAVIDLANLDYLLSGADADVWPPEREEMGDVLLYRHAQPAPVVPDEIKHRIGGLDWGWEGEFNRGWNACRAAMLNGGKS